ncbi:MAG: TetR/AcrR family transcriptional regulator C-terminal domain-containing protein [Xanthobacteraceae bacterium]
MMAEPVRGVPRHSARATRSAGQRMRTCLLDHASVLFRARGLSAVAIADIAAAADAFPSQITYYFGSKEALFVEAACRDLLHAARAAEEAAHAASDRHGYFRALVESVIHADALGFFVEAMTLARRRPDLSPLIARTVERLQDEGLRAYAGEMKARGWLSRQDPALLARRFWTVAIGITIEGHATRRPAGLLVTDMMALLETPPSAGAAPVPLRAVASDRVDQPADQAKDQP